MQPTMDIPQSEVRDTARSFLDANPGLGTYRAHVYAEYFLAAYVYDHDDLMTHIIALVAEPDDTIPHWKEVLALEMDLQRLPQ